LVESALDRDRRHHRSNATHIEGVHRSISNRQLITIDRERGFNSKETQNAQTTQKDAETAKLLVFAAFFCAFSVCLL
jgi:hypothetical protein